MGMREMILGRMGNSNRYNLRSRIGNRFLQHGQNSPRQEQAPSINNIFGNFEEQIMIALNPIINPAHSQRIGYEEEMSVHSPAQPQHSHFLRNEMSHIVRNEIRNDYVFNRNIERGHSTHNIPPTISQFRNGGIRDPTTSTNPSNMNINSLFGGSNRNNPNYNAINLNLERRNMEDDILNSCTVMEEVDRDSDRRPADLPPPNTRTQTHNPAITIATNNNSNTLNNQTPPNLITLNENNVRTPNTLNTNTPSITNPNTVIFDRNLNIG